MPSIADIFAHANYKACKVRKPQQLCCSNNNVETPCREGIMPICIECCYPVSQLYHVLHSRNNKTPAPPIPSPAYGKHGIASTPKPARKVSKIPQTKAKTKKLSGGGDVRLTQCPRCKRFADKYVEHDFVVLFIDLALVKPQVSEILYLITKQVLIM